MLLVRLALCFAALGAGLAQAAEFEDVAPQPLRSVFLPPDPHGLYMTPEPDLPCEKACPDALGPEDFPRVVDGRLAMPARYDLSKLDAHDRALLERALIPAHRYADVNNAVADGYVFQDHFVSGMGIHMQNLERILAKEMDPAKPQFLTYARSRATGAYQLLQIGYIRPRKPEQGPYRFFHSTEAPGHFHPEPWCVKISSGVFWDSQAPCASGATYVGPIWMMHVTVNLFSADGLFTDFFSCGNHISRTGRQYSFFGAPQWTPTLTERVVRRYPLLGRLLPPKPAAPLASTPPPAPKAPRHPPEHHHAVHEPGKLGESLHPTEHCNMMR